MTDKPWQIWIDTGGTFTDCIGTDPGGVSHSLKVLSNSTLRGKVSKVQDGCIYISESWPVSTDLFSNYEFRTLDDSFTSSIKSFDPINRCFYLQEVPIATLVDLDFEITAHEEVPILAARILTETPLSQVLPAMDLKLGSTKGTNALLERKTARTGLIITKGFKDLLIINTQQRPELFQINIQKNKPYYDHVLEIDERVSDSGEVVKTISPDQLRKLGAWVESNEIESIAIAFLFSFRNSVNEEMVKEELVRSGVKYISTSHSLFNAIKILPRAETCVVNAALSPVIQQYLNGISASIRNSGSFRVMSSAGGLAGLHDFEPKDSLLSGPAGGLVGSVISAKRSGASRLVTFDMGGTSTDVSRFDQYFDYTYETVVGGAMILSPAMHIETIAAGGGSICSYDGVKFRVGPESAGADPGPACYGAGGPLTITDVNLLLGKINPQDFGIPVHHQRASEKLSQIKTDIYKDYREEYSEDQILKAFEQIANEMMAEAIKKISVSKGYSPSDHSLVAFGGAGGLHACQVADLLNIREVIIPDNAGLLSAFGIGHAFIERFKSRQILLSFNSASKKIINLEFSQLEELVIGELITEGFKRAEIQIRQRLVYLRLKGQDATVELPWEEGKEIPERFRAKYLSVYGHWVEGRSIEIESIKCVGSNIRREAQQKGKVAEERRIKGVKMETQYGSIDTFDRTELKPGTLIEGPAIIGSKTHTTFLPSEWRMILDENRNEMITRVNDQDDFDIAELEAANIELFMNRFTSIAEEMGAMLQKASFSVNIKERLDFSCAILDPNGYLVVNAPHIPVHLGSLGICVREVIKVLDLSEGDVAITNHPGFGGSHLPDITLISPVFYKGVKLGYVANRAHHAEIGGKTPGSMPVDALVLEEEGVIFKPIIIAKNQKLEIQLLTDLLTKAKYPTRALEENLADLQGALASITAGRKGLIELAEKYSSDTVIEYLEKIQEYSCQLFSEISLPNCQAEEFLDDGSRIRVKITNEHNRLNIDFTGSSPTHPGNMNATKAITTSAVLYVLRLLIDQPLPLNEGILRKAELMIPNGSMLNPDFNLPDTECPAVVGGNTETSQRIVDTLLKALEIAACSQGTMNNVLFGNQNFGYYETICGGTGATVLQPGADAVHQHMTNTRITDPEIIEHRYPVKIKRFEMREDSGGYGLHRGGNGVVREIEFTEPCKLTILAEHRKVKPYGLNNGLPGMPGVQYVLKKDGSKHELLGKDHFDMEAGDRFVVMTPGGGGWKKADGE